MSMPLYTEPAKQYLGEILRPGWRVFEYGSGGSTLYYQERCAEVIAIEHDAGWAGRSKGAARVVDRDSPTPPGAATSEERFFALGFDLPRHHDGVQTEYHGMENWAWRGYAGQIFNHPAGYFDLVCVDGMARSLCLYYAALMCNQAGYIVLDNSCRWQYNDAQAYIMSQGWKRRDFWQPGHPGYCTSFFSRSYDASDDGGPRRKEQGDLYHAMGW